MLASQTRGTVLEQSVPFTFLYIVHIQAVGHLKHTVKTGPNE